MSASFLQPYVEWEQQTQMVNKCSFEGPGWSLILVEPSGFKWRKHVIWMWCNRLHVSCFCWWLITHRLILIRVSCGAWVDVKAQNISEDFSAPSITSGLFHAWAARDSVHKTATQAINTWLCGMNRTVCVSVCVCVYVCITSSQTHISFMCLKLKTWPYI